MRILVTGASGLLGLNLALEASRQHVVFGSVYRHGLNTKAFQVIRCNLLDPLQLKSLLEQSHPDWVINCAALADLDACEADPALAQKINSELPRQLAAHVARGGARLAHISTDAVFDGKEGNYSEDDEPNPLSVYARTKLEGERAVLEANPQAIVARVNLFGWSISGKRSLAEWFINNLSLGRSVMGFTDVYFCPLLANDLGELLLEMLDHGLKGLYHVVSSECSTKYDFGRRLARLFGYDEDLIQPASVSQAGLSAARSPNLTLRTDKLTRDLGKYPPDLSVGLQKFYQLYREGFPEKIRQMASSS